MLQRIILLTLILIISKTYSQDSLKLKSNKLNNATNKLIDLFVKSKLNISSRTVFMSTINEGALKDDYALASGLGLGIQTKSYYGFQLTVSGYFLKSLASSNIDIADSLTLQPNRYETGLFDVTNISNTKTLARLEELNLKYTLSKSSISFGKINLNTPFLNAQDGRMRPTFEEGVWLSIKESDKFGFNGGWLWQVAPRSTVNWYSLSNSVGLYPVGVNSDGSKSGYNQNIMGNSGIAIANIYFNPTKNIKVNLWDSYFENVMNTSLIEINIEQPREKIKFYEGVMFLRQDAINNGGNVNQLKTYTIKGNQSNVISAQLGFKNKRINTTINYTHITGDGRYLMPREWGKDPFYTFLPRERNEGFGDVQAFMTKTTLSFNKFKTSVGYGYYQLPDVKNYRLNKYGMPSYHQINYDASYTFEGFLKGLELKLLVAYKLKQGETYGNLKYIYNKVNMINFNFIIDFKI